MPPNDYALSSLEELVRHVFENRNGLIDGLSYSELSKRIGRMNKRGIGNARGMGPFLDRMGYLLRDLEGKWGEPIPKIQSMVVQKSGREKGLPSDGMEVFWPGYKSLSPSEKKNKTQTEFKKIAAFGSRWNEVLRGFGLSEMTEQGKKGVLGQTRGTGGESGAHKALKEFIYEHPEVVGATSDWDGFMEYALPTLDEIDVLFKSGEACIAVEVKAKISDRCPVDYERGLYQTVKYDALLRAMAKCEKRTPLSIRSVLVLGSVLPLQYHALAKKLGVEFYENIDPTD